jgi:hypothetical protein
MKPVAAQFQASFAARVGINVSTADFDEEPSIPSPKWSVDDALDSTVESHKVRKNKQIMVLAGCVCNSFSYLKYRIFWSPKTMMIGTWTLMKALCKNTWQDCCLMMYVFVVLECLNIIP